MDLAAVKVAPPRELARGAVAAARNACGLVEDAELLSGAGRMARAYSLAGLAVEEVGKVGSLKALAAMPGHLRQQAPVGRLLEWHQWKLVAGMLIAAVPFAAPDGVTTRFVTMPLSEVAEILDNAQAFAQDADRLKQRGLYVDVDRSGQVREPSELTTTDVREQLDRARQAAAAVRTLLDPGAPPQWHASPEPVAFSRALVSAFGETRPARSPGAAADVLLNTASKLLG
jgi:AbiV family abortive infection protein